MTAVAATAAPGAPPRRDPSRGWLLRAAVVGFAASTGLVIFAARVGPVLGAWLPTSWAGLTPRTQPTVTAVALSAYLDVGCVLALAGCWALLHYRADRGLVPLRWAWGIVAAWATPMLIGPPLFSSDVYSYAAQGVMLQQGLDPYRLGVNALGANPALAAVDPRWRAVPSPYGPVAGAIEHVAATIGGGPVGAVVLLHLLIGACAIGIGLLAAALATPERRPAVVLLTAGSPLMLLQVVSAGHLEGPMLLALLASLVLARRGRIGWALVVAVVAGAIKAPALFAVPAILVHELPGVPAAERRQWLARHLGVVAAAAAACTALVPDGWGWIAGLRSPTVAVTHLAPTSILSSIVQWAFGVHSPTVAQAIDGWCRDAGVAVALCYAGYLLWRPRRRLELTVGAVLLVGGALCPVVYPWYLLWGVVCLAPVARPGSRRWLAAVVALMPLQALPGLGSTGAPTAAVFVLATLATVGWMLWRRTPELPPVVPYASTHGQVHVLAPPADAPSEPPWPIAMRLPLV